MHKDEASRGFALLASPNRVKIAKMLYVKGNLTYDQLLNMITDDEAQLNESLDLMEKGSLIINDNNTYSINKEYVDTLLDFIRRPCGCTK